MNAKSPIHYVNPPREARRGITEQDLLHALRRLRARGRLGAKRPQAGPPGAGHVPSAPC